MITRGRALGLVAGAGLALLFVSRARGMGLEGVPGWRPARNVEIKKSEAEWRKELSPDRYAVLREAATEPPFTGTLLHNKEKGVYVCAACHNELFTSATKFESGTGWPSFWEPVKKGAVIERHDSTYGMDRIEVLCGRCGSHLGHVFDDGPAPTNLRYCMNSLALDFEKKG